MKMMKFALLFLYVPVLLSSVVCDYPFSGRMTSTWLNTQDSKAAYTVDVIKMNGGSSLFSVVFIYCNFNILDNGTFYLVMNPNCYETITGLRSMGIGVEPVLKISLTGIHALYENMSLSLPAIIEALHTYNLTGGD